MLHSILDSIDIVMHTSRLDYFLFDSDTQSFLNNRFKKHKVISDSG